MGSLEKDLKAVLLVGGMGTRLRSVVSSAPKPMATVGGRPFLELLVRQLSHQQIRRMVFCTGYLGQEIEDVLGDGLAFGVQFEYSREALPLGTAGALKFAEPLLRDLPDFLVMNGDSFMEIDFRELMRFHHKSGGIASMAVLRLKNKMRYGTVQVSPEGRVTGFAEKTDGDSAGFVSAGIYIFDRQVFEHIPEGPASLERDVFPRLLEYGVYASEQHGVFIDIGTPEDYARAQDLCDRLYAAARPRQPLGDSE